MRPDNEPISAVIYRDKTESQLSRDQERPFCGSFSPALKCSVVVILIYWG